MLAICGKKDQDIGRTEATESNQNQGRVFYQVLGCGQRPDNWFFEDPEIMNKSKAILSFLNNFSKLMLSEI